VFGAVVVNTPRDRIVQQALDFSTSLRAPTRKQLGFFTTPATSANVAKLSLTEHDVKDLKNCKPNDCKLKLPASAMQRAQSEIKWSGGNVAAQVNALFRVMTVSYVNDYRTRGDAALVVYDNIGHVRASDAFSSLLGDSRYQLPTQDAVIRYLKQYPAGRLDGVRESIYWCMDQLKGLKAVLSVNHALVYAPPDQPGVTVIANKQIYADRYLEAMLDVTALAERAPSGGKPGVYLLKLRRMRFDRLQSGGLLDIRGKVVKGMREQMVSDLQRLKATGEQSTH